MTRRKLSRKEIVHKIIGIVLSVDPDAAAPEIIWCRGQIILWWQDGRGRRVVVDVGRTETFVERLDEQGQCVACTQVQAGGIGPNGQRLDLWSLVRAGYSWVRAPQ